MRAVGIKMDKLDTHGEWIDLGEVVVPMDNTADVVRSLRREHIPDEVIAASMCIPFEEVAEAIAIDEEWQRKLGIAQHKASLLASKRVSRNELEALDEAAIKRLNKG